MKNADFLAIESGPIRTPDGSAVVNGAVNTQVRGSSKPKQRLDRGMIEP